MVGHDAMTKLTPWQESVLASAVHKLAQGRLGHALLLCGPPNMGKREVAEVLAKRLLCPTPDTTGHACGQCRSCRFFAAGTHADLQRVNYELNDKGDKFKTEISVEQIRRLGQWFSLTPQFGNVQVAVIAPAEGMNMSAANALLKTLEEPSSNRYLLLVTDHPGRLPTTIRSRCQRIEFRLPEPELAHQWLRERGIADADAKAALAAARGHPGLAADWLEQGGLKLRKEVQADLQALSSGRASAVAVAQRWLADDSADLRLRFAADIALESGMAGRDGGRRAGDIVRIGDWFDAINRCRAQLRAPLRHDLVLAGLLHEWGNMSRRAS
jgi:DNA polymerase-3 subunit delta'